MKALVGAFNQEKAPIGAFSVIVQLHRLIDLRHYFRTFGTGLETNQLFNTLQYLNAQIWLPSLPHGCQCPLVWQPPWWWCSHAAERDIRDTARDTLVTRRQAEATGDKVSWYVGSVGSGSVLTGISRRVIRSSHQSPVTLNICSIMLGPTLKVKFVSRYKLSCLNSELNWHNLTFLQTWADPCQTLVLEYKYSKCRYL